VTDMWTRELLAVAEAVGDQLSHLARAAHRGVQHRSHALLDPHLHARQAQRHHDVGEEDGCVDAVAPYWLQRRLGREPRIQAGLQHRDAGAPPQRAVLRQGPARLTHEPHGRACGSAARQRLQDRGLRRGGSAAVAPAACAAAFTTPPAVCAALAVGRTGLARLPGVN